MTAQLEQIDSQYFGEEDILSIQTGLIEEGCINTDPVFEEDYELATNPAFLAKALDRLIDSLIAGIIEYPEDMLFGTCDGNYRGEFERAVKAIKASGMTKEELRAMR